LSDWIKSHLLIYTCTYNINNLWNIGFLLTFLVLYQWVWGIYLSLYYFSYHSFYSILFILREVYYGWTIRYLHSTGASFIFILLIVHIGRGLYYYSVMWCNTLWLSGVGILLILLGVSFIGYILVWGQMSFWGVIVIANLISFVPCLIEWICGGFYFTIITLSRFLMIHIILSFVMCGLSLVHWCYLHYICSNNALSFKTYIFLSFYPVIVLKDYLGILIFVLGITSQSLYGIFSFSHADNCLEVNELYTPHHILPEWYFLSLYAILKVIPDKNIGFIVFLIFIFNWLLMTEPRNISCIWRLSSYMWINGNLLILYFFTIIMVNLYIGAQLPEDIFLSYGRLSGFLLLIIIWSNLWFPSHISNDCSYTS